ncbi:hypothetical protein QBC37DRAFT_373752 [Rhypophila decipiens]|uniref:Uncharacterized protein n=1 Tax=Rhypophila decipiens TaxID=261697 RepID=A0AAN6Y821_9PEZI|nr:hypothetical protein QBC37DRAFT_373752 [Rhypophila decipiens]
MNLDSYVRLNPYSDDEKANPNATPTSGNTVLIACVGAMVAATALVGWNGVMGLFKDRGMDNIAAGQAGKRSGH